ncbi:MAG TPA: T9SS type A sorting domain-containing protein [Caldithrix abyssi]|uniref:T9SS type A sorting domain-containing protein n=1 Tax=Caldithrix abyssi TaxID=187145 RepID=A0A7V5LJ44_CALAY|nr:T9SS type A sorting domain-containing protein [Caldithrix abyssi]
MPEQLILWQNFPNPFNPATKLRFQIPYANNVTLEIFSITGQKVRTLINEQIEHGWHEVQWDGLDEAGSSVPSGIYFARLRTGSQERVIKMCLIK